MSLLPVALVAVLSGSGLVLAVAVAGRRPVLQPIEFDHRRHAKAEIPCSQCHEGVEGSARAGIAGVPVCMECHGEDEPATPGMKLLHSQAKAGQEIPWIRLYRLPAHVVFSHERHVSLGGVACGSCHGNHGDTERPPPGPEPRVLTMDGCIDCHRDLKADTDCIACHK